MSEVVDGELRLRLPFTPRKAQEPLLYDRAQRIVAVIHRRFGKSTTIMWRLIFRALREPKWPRTKPVRVIHTLPYGVQWERTGLWDQLVVAANAIPGAEVRKAERRIIFPSGGVYQTGGMDNPDAWRGGYADEFVEDEADDINGGGHETVIEPMLADVGGTRVWAGTPKGNGRLKDRYNRAAHAHGYSRHLLRYDQTGIFGEIIRSKDEGRWLEAVGSMRAEMSEEEFAQEMECSFEAPNSGAYYAKQLQQAERDGRIGEVAYEPRWPVWTGWDLGMDDATAIWCAQITPGGEWRWLRYTEDSGEVLGHYAGMLRQWPYEMYERHVLPHDAAVRDLGAVQATTREATLNSLGVRPTMILPRTGPADRINAMRLVLPKSRFDARLCERGLKSLWHYRREWNDDAQVFRANPVHDWASHAADAAGHLAQGARPPREANRRLPQQSPAWSPYG